VNGKPYNVNVKPSARNTKNADRPVTYLAAAAAHAETQEMIVTTVTQVAAQTAQVQKDTFAGLVEKLTEAAQENARQSAETQRLLVANLEMQQQNHQTVTHGVNHLTNFGERQALGIEALVRVMTNAHQQQAALPPPPALLLAPQAAAPQAHAPGAAAAALLLYQQYQAALAAIPQVCHPEAHSRLSSMMHESGATGHTPSAARCFPDLRNHAGPPTGMSRAPLESPLTRLSGCGLGRVCSPHACRHHRRRHSEGTASAV
jgi:hypothetical protein